VIVTALVVHQRGGVGHVSESETMTHLVSHNGFEFFNFKRAEQRRRDQNIAGPWEKTEDPGGGNGTLEKGPEDDIGITEIVLVEELLQHSSVRPLREPRASPHRYDQVGEKPDKQQKKQNEGAKRPQGVLLNSLRCKRGDLGDDIGEKKNREPGRQNDEVQFALGGEM